MSASPNSEKLEDALDFKYGNYDYKEDARSIADVEFGKRFKEILDKNIKQPRENKKLLLAGSNDGYELPYLNGFEVTALDFSNKALQRLREKFPLVKTVHCNIESLIFEDNTFDVYVSLRAIHSSNINLNKALEESLRVVKKNGVLVYSVSNGYLVNGKLIKGMYIPSAEETDTKKPYLICDKIKQFLEDKNIQVEIVEIGSEIIIIAKK